MENVFQIAVLRVCLAALAALLAASALVGLRRVGSLLLRRLKPIALAALLPMAALLTDFAGEKNTNMPMRVIRPVASQVFFPCGAVTNADWLAHGACEDWSWKFSVLIGRRWAYGTLVTSLFNGAGRDLQDLRDIRDGNFRSLSSRRSWWSRRSRWRFGT